LYSLQLSSVTLMVFCEKEYPPTLRVQCSTRKDSEKLEQILQKIKQGDAITEIIRMGTIVYVHMVDEKIDRKHT